MNGICKCFFHYLLSWIEYVNVFTLCLCKWNLWMLSLWFFHMNTICECFLYSLFIWIEYVNLLFMVCFYRWNMWMFSSSFVYINGIYRCFVRRLFIRMKFVNAFFIVCLYELNQWKCFNGYFIWIEHMCIFFIPCLNGSNMWMFPLMFAYMCFYCGDLDSVQGALINIEQSFVALFKYRTYISTCFCHYFFFILFLLFICQFIGLSE
jgi:hypothetical protein